MDDEINSKYVSCRVIGQTNRRRYKRDASEDEEEEEVKSGFFSWLF